MSSTCGMTLYGTAQLCPSAARCCRPGDPYNLAGPASVTGTSSANP